jgi:hypothetical protein
MSNHDHPTPKSGIPPPPLPTFFIPFFTKNKNEGANFAQYVVAQFIPLLSRRRRDEGGDWAFLKARWSE